MTTLPISLSTEFKAALLDALQQAVEPLNATDLRARLPGEKKPTAAKLNVVLEYMVASGEADRFDPIKGKAIRYWVPGRDEHAALREQLRAAVRCADEPRSAKQLCANLSSAKPPPFKKAEQILEAMVASGELHRFEPAKGKAIRYWDRGPEENARQIIVATLAKGKGKAPAPMTFPELRKAVKSQLKGASEDDLSELLQELLDHGRVYKALNFDEKRDKQAYSTQPPDLRGYLEREFTNLYQKYQKAGVPREQVDTAALSYLGTSPSAPVSEVSRGHPQDFERVILEIFQELRREKFAHTGLVPIHALRRLIKERAGDHAGRHDVLDEKIKGLWSGGKLSLLPINDATGVTAEELNDSIRGAQETWFYLEAKS